MFHRKKNLRYYDISVRSAYNIVKPFLTLARLLCADHDLQFVDQPALVPSSAPVDKSLVSQYEKELKMAAKYPMPEDDEDL